MMLPFLSLAFTFLFSDRSSQQASVYRQQVVLTSPSRLSAEQGARIEHSRQIAAEINDLAGRIHSEADASALVDKIAALFADALPPAWAIQGIRRRIAHAEYEAVTDASQLIPEQRIADVWNEYVREIGAPDEPSSLPQNCTICATRISPPLNSCGQAVKTFGPFPAFMLSILAANFLMVAAPSKRFASCMTWIGCLTIFAGPASESARASSFQTNSKSVRTISPQLNNSQLTWRLASPTIRSGTPNASSSSNTGPTS